MIGIEMKLNIPVHYQMGNQYNKAGDPVICISRVICPCFDIVHSQSLHLQISAWTTDHLDTTEQPKSTPTNEI